MTIQELINRAFIQVKDTSQRTYSRYQFLEYYNEGNQLMNGLVAKFMPSLNTKTFTGTGFGKLELPEQIVGIVKITADGEEVKKFKVNNLKTITFNANKEQEITIDYVGSAGYKDFGDDSGYPAEIESLLVTYIVARALALDVSGMASSWAVTLQELANVSGSGEGVVISKGYWNYDGSRTDYGN